MSAAERPCLLVCTGKDCRDAKGFTALMELARELPGGVEVPCQSLCHGPIAGVVTSSGVRWVSRVRTKQARHRVGRAVERGRLGSTLRAEEVRSRRGVVRGAGRARFVRSGRTVNAFG